MASEKFPEKNEFRIHSHPLFILGDEDGDSEMLVFDANMVIRTGEPKVGSHRKRAVDVEVVEWTAKAWSQLLDSELELHLAGDQQPRSHVTALSAKRDLPGRLEFNMRWDLSVGGEVALKGLDGSATGRITAFPPKGDIFQIGGKDLIVGERFHVRPIACACASLPFTGRMVSASG